ncbi:hypothetical protein [Zhenpiania hominis]|uniref:Fibronectin type-III domain-containing protein n=1 Tax=Zhenpiania hominis TaxID=2763644 RepID=A0A923NN93_9FIRM|nr:hypothetical protein [Zhenpiania hominis]MBC6680267.1 hypothetical protein [Zhenpiania hominis]
MKKKLIAALTSAAMVATMVPATAFATTADAPPKAEVKQTQQAATTYAETQQNAFTKALNAIPDMTNMTEWTATIDALVTAACEDYDALTDDDVTEIGENAINDFKSKVTKLWELRLAEVKAAQEKVDDEVISTNNLESVTAFEAVYNDFLAGTNTDIVYTVANTTAVTGGAAGLSLEILTQVNEAATAAAAVKTDLDKIVSVVESIDGIEPVTDQNYSTIDLTTAANAYNDLDAGLQPRVGNYQWLKDCQEEVAKLKDEVSKANAALAEIEESPSTLTSATIGAYEKAYNDAKAEYDKLLPGQQEDSALTNKGRLATAETNITNYYAGVEKEKAVRELIQNLPEATLANALEIMEVNSAFEALSDGAIGTIANLANGFRGNISNELRGKLTDSVATLTQLATADDDAIKEVTAPVKEMIEALPDADAITVNDKEAIEAARTAYDAVIKIDTSVAIKNELATALTTLQAAENALGEAKTAAEAADNAAVKVFTDAVDAIGVSVPSGSDKDDIAAANEVDDKYINLVAAANSEYLKLTEAQKEISDAKDAYAMLQIAQANVDAYNSLTSLVPDITSIPNAADIDTSDTAMVQKVKDTYAAYNALPTGVKAQVGSVFLVTPAQIENLEAAYEAVTKAENQTAAEAVVSAINALTELPEAFTSKADIDSINATIKQIKTNYGNLTGAQKKEVGNYQALANYETAFDGLVKTYANDLYDAVKDVDTTQELSAENAGKIAELVALIDEGYVEASTSDITNYVPATYEALKEALSAFQEKVGNLANASVDAIASQTYTGSTIVPAIVVKDATGTAIDAEQYTYICENNVNVGTAKVTIFPTNGSAYTGVATATFEITAASINGATIDVDNQTYTGSALRPAVTVKIGDNTVAAANYDVAYSNNTNAGTATVTITGKNNYTGTASKTFTINRANIQNASVSGVANRFYTGKARTQTDLRVTMAGRTLSASNYSVKYANNKNVGKATLTITGQGNYTGTITKTFIVKPRKVANVKVTKGKKRVTVRYKKQNGARYQIYYKTAGSKAKTVKTAAVKRTIKNLKSGKRYTIKVRAYKKIDGKTYYGKYSTAKKVRVR